MNPIHDKKYVIEWPEGNRDRMISAIAYVMGGKALQGLYERRELRELSTADLLDLYNSI